MDEDVPLDSTRLVLAVFALVMFVLCFTPAPIELMDLVAEVDVSGSTGPSASR